MTERNKRVYDFICQHEPIKKEVPSKLSQNQNDLRLQKQQLQQNQQLQQQQQQQQKQPLQPLNSIQQQKSQKQQQVTEKITNQKFSSQDYLKKPNNIKKQQEAVNGRQNNQQLEEQKVQKVGLFTNKPSDKYTKIKTEDPFSDKSKQKLNSFAYVYNAGGIPCKIDHRAVNNKLKWNNDIVLSELSLDPILVTCFEGLIEEKHPYNFISKQAIIDILQALQIDNCSDKLLPILPKLVWPLRTALTNKSMQVFENALEVLKLLSDLIQEEINPHLKNILKPIICRQDAKLKDKIFEILKILEQNGGEEGQKIIKQMVPVYFH